MATAAAATSSMLDLFKLLGVIKVAEAAPTATVLLAIPLYELWRTHGFAWASAQLTQLLATPDKGPATPQETAQPAPVHAARIVCQKVMDSKSAHSPPTRIDAILHYVATLPTNRAVMYNGTEFVPSMKEEVLVSQDQDVYFRVLTLDEDIRSGIQNIRFELGTYKGDMATIQRFIESCQQNMERRMRNKLGGNLYFFDQVVERNKGSHRDPLPKDYLVFRKNKFMTTRTFNNVFFEQRPTFHGRFKFFLHNKEWYDAKGIPHSFGVMMHGSPGCGKTSTVKAMANESRRHIINVHLSDIKTNTQLKHLFYSDELYVLDTDGRMEAVNLPVSERLYVIEDIDAMNSVVLKRAAAQSDALPPPAGGLVAGGGASGAPTGSYTDFLTSGDLNSGHRQGRQGGAEQIVDPLDLSTLLNVLDGTLETPGRMLAITTNHPERLDPALVRPGRIDMMLELRKANRQIIVEMLNSFYEGKLTSYTVDDFGTHPALDYKWTPAEVNQILFQNMVDPEAAVAVLVN